MICSNLLTWRPNYERGKDLIIKQLFFLPLKKKKKLTTSYNSKKNNYRPISLMDVGAKSLNKAVSKLNPVVYKKDNKS